MKRASLNHIYRLVWSERLGAFIPVAENAGVGGKRSRSGRSFLALAGLAMSSAAMADGITVAPGGGAALTEARNGVPVVNIANPNSAGLSHNQFLDYNVTVDGLILNNIRAREVVGNSQLAGTLLSNPNLNRAAEVILNEVISTNPSELRGYTEVAGAVADVVVANPYGITCDGCGFLNTNRVTLTTGVPQFEGAALGFRVNRGEVLITGNGLDATDADYLNIVTRAVRLAGKVNAKDFNAVLGNNVWDYASGSVEVAGAGDPVALALDSTELGGMYANRISIQVTEQGAGVRVLGNAAASGGDLVINAAGQLLVASEVYASGNLELASSDAGSSAIRVDNASLSADQDLRITAQSGGVELQSGLLYAGKNLDLEADRLADTGSGEITGSANNRYGAQSLTVALSGDMKVNGTGWGSGGTLDVTASDIDLGDAGSIVYSDGSLALASSTGDLLLGTAVISSTADLRVAAAGTVSTSAGQNQLVSSSEGDVRVEAGIALDNAGVISAEAGAVALAVDGTITNTGTILSATDLEVFDRQGDNAQALINEGGIGVGGSLALQVGRTRNPGLIQVGAGVRIRGEELDNEGELVFEQSGQEAVELQVAALNNTGLLQAGSDLALDLTASLRNQGAILAGGDLRVGGAGSTMSITNAAGAALQAAGNLIVQARFAEQGGDLLGRGVVIDSAGFTNAGLIQSENTAQLTIEGTLTNVGTVLSGGALALAAQGLTNQADAVVQAGAGSELDVQGLLNNQGTVVLLGEARSSLAMGELTNAGTIQSADDLSLLLRGASFLNQGTIAAGADLELASQANGLALRNAADALLLAGMAESNVVRINAAGATLLNEAGAFISGAGFDINTTSVTNAGGIVAASGTGTFALGGSLQNTGLISAGDVQSGALSIAAERLDNTGSEALIQSYHDLSLELRSALANQGTVLADDTLTITGAGTRLTITNDGTLQAGSARGDQLVIGGNAVTLDNRNNGVAGANELQFALAALSNSGAILGGSVAHATGPAVSSRIVVTGSAIDNLGTIAFGNSTNGGSGSLTASSLNNGADGLLQASDDLALNLATSLDNAGLVLAGGRLDVNSTGSGLTISNGVEISGVGQPAAAMQGTDGLYFSGPISALNNRAQGGLYGLAGNLSLSRLDNRGDLYGNAGLTFTIANALTNSGVIVLDQNSTGGTSTINAGTLDNQAGATLQSNSALTLNLSGASLTNDGVLLAGTDLSITSTGALTITNGNGDTTPAFLQALDTLTINSNAITLVNQTDGVFYGDSLALMLGNISNTGVVQSNGATGSVTVAGALTNDGTFSFGNATDGGTGTINAASLTNSAGALLQSYGDLALNLSTSLDNYSVILAGERLDVNSTQAGLAITNHDGALDADDNPTVVIQGLEGLFLNGPIGALNNGIAGIYGLSSDLSFDSLTNRGDLYGNAGLTFTIANALTNSGVIVLDQNSTGGTSTINAGTLDNQAGATLQSNSALTLNLSGASLTNDGVLLAGTDLSITSTGALTITNGNGDTTPAFLQALDTLTINSNAITLVNQTDGVFYGDSLALMLGNISNTGVVQSNGATGSVTVAGALTNDGTFSFGNATDGGTGTINAASLTNSAGALLQSYGDLALNLSTSLDNYSVILAGERLDVNSTQAGLAITNHDGALDADDNPTVVIQGLEGLFLNGPIGALNNGIAGIYGLSSDLSFDSLTNRGDLYGNAGLTFTIANALTNSGVIVLDQNSTGGTSTINAGTLDNQAGATLQSNSALTLNLSGASLTNDGVLLAGTDLSITSTGALTITNGNGDTTPAFLQALDTLTINSNAITLVNQTDGVFYGDSLALMLGNISNTGVVQSNGATGSVTVAGALTNDGTFSFGNATDGGTGTINAASLTNSAGALLQSYGDLALNLSTSLDNYSVILAGERLDVNSTQAGLAITNHDGALDADDNPTVVIQGLEGLFLNGPIGALNNGIAGIYGLSSDLSFDSLTNRGDLYGNAGLTFTIANALTNSGVIVLDQNSTGGTSTINAGTLDNQAGATLQSNSALTLNLSGASLTNDGVLLAGTDLSITSTGALTITNGNGDTTPAFLQALDTLTINSNAITLVNQSDGVVYGGSLNLNIGAFTNAGATQFDGLNSSLTVLGTLDNTGGALSFGTAAAGGSGTINAGSLINGTDGTVQAYGDLTLLLGTALNNPGLILAGDTLSIQLSAAGLGITNSGLLQGGSDFGDRIIIGGPSVTLNNQAAGTLLANELQFTLDTLTNAGTILVGTLDNGSGMAGSSTITSGTVSNTGTLAIGNATDGGTATVTAASLSNGTGALLQSIDDLTLELATTLDNNGVILAGDQLVVNSTGAGLTITNNNGPLNAGGHPTVVIQGLNNLFLNGTITALNNGIAGIYGLSSDLTLATFSNEGELYANEGLTFTVGGQFDNGGVIVLDQFGRGGTSTINAQGLLNQTNATLQSNSSLNLNLSGASFSNDGTVYVADDLRIAGTGGPLTVRNGDGNGGPATAFLQALGDLLIGTTGLQPTFNNADLNALGAPITLINASDGVIYGDSVGIEAASITNSGQLLADTRSQLDISGTITNAGNILLSTLPTTITQDQLNTVRFATLDNQAGADFQSVGNTVLLVGTALTNNGRILVSNQLGMLGGIGNPQVLSGYSVTNNGLIDVGDELRFDGLPDLLIGAGGRIRTDSIIAFLTNLTMNGTPGAANVAEIVVEHAGSIGVEGFLTMASPNNRIIGSTGNSPNGRGELNLSLGNAYTHVGLFAAAAGDFNIFSRQFINSPTGGILGYNGGNVFISSVDLINQGTIFGSAVRLVGAPSIRNERNGIIESLFSFGITADNFENYGTIFGRTGGGISAGRLINGLEGDYTRDAMGVLSGPAPDYSYRASIIVTNGSLEISALDLRNQYGVLSASDNVTINALPVFPNNTSVVNDDLNFGISGSLVGGPTGIFAVNGTVAIGIVRPFDSVQNFNAFNGTGANPLTPVNQNPVAPDGGGTVNVNNGTNTADPNGGGGGQTVGAVAPDPAEFADVGDAATPEGEGGGGELTDNGVDPTNQMADDGVEGTLQDLGPGGPILAGDGQNGGLQAVGGGNAGVIGGGRAETPSRQGSTLGRIAAVAVTAAPTPSPVVSAVDLLQMQSVLDLGGVAVNLPSNPNGVFVPSQDPDSGFLVESNPLFTGGDILNAVSSDDLVRLLNVDPGVLTLRLGDAAYENYVIRNQIVAQTNTGLLSGYLNQADMVSTLYANAAGLSDALGLQWGKPLTAAQQSQLGNDIVWMVETEVAGVKVLAPVVYLSPATQLAYATGSGIVGNAVAINTGSLTNQGQIAGRQAVNINTTNALVNRSGASITSSGGVQLSSMGGVDNQAGATIRGGEFVTVTGRDVNNAGNIAGGSFVGIDAQRNIGNQGVISSQGNVALRSLGGDIANTGQVTGNNIGISALGGSISNVGGNIAAAGTAALVAAQDINNSRGTLSGNDVIAHALSGEVNNKGGAIIGRNSADILQAKDLDTSGGSIQTNNLNLTSTAGGVKLSGLGEGTGSNRLVVQARDDIANVDNNITSNTLALRSTEGSILNERGTLTGNQVLTLDAKQNIDNLGGTLSGGNISLVTREGDITSRTLTQDVGDTTRITDRASINAGNNLSVSSGRDLNIIGSDVTAGGSARLGAANDINVLTVTERSTSQLSGQAGKTTIESTTRQETNVGSNIKVGDTLVVDAGNNVDIVGSRVSAGQAAIKAGGNLTIESALDRSSTVEQAKTSGVLRSKTADTTIDTTRNVGSTITTTGALSLKSGGDTTIAASTVDVGGDLFTKAGGSVNVIDRQDETTIKLESSEKGFGVGGGLYGTQKITQDTFESNTRGSSITVGGDSAIIAGQDINIRGSDLKVGGDSILDAQNDINITAGQNIREQSTRTETTAILSSDRSASASAGAKAEANKTATSVRAEAGAEANVDLNTSINLVKKSVVEEESGSIKHQASNVTAGGSTLVSAGNRVAIKGSNLQSDGDQLIQARELEVTTAQDLETSSSRSVINRIGIFTESTAGASAEADVALTPVSGSASASASAQVGAESITTLGFRREEENSDSLKVTNQSSTIKSGGSTTFDIKDKATFVGANVEAGGDLNIKAGELENLAAQDYSVERTDSISRTAGLYVGVEASAQASASVNSSTVMNQSATASASAQAAANAGVRYTDESSKTEKGSITNVTNAFTAGGNINRNVTGTIRDQGTQLTAGGNISQTAQTLIEEEVSDVAFESSTDSTRDARFGVYAAAGAEARAGAQTGALTRTEVGANADVNASVGISASYSQKDSQSEGRSTKAVTGSYTAGGNISSVTTGSSTFRGTQMTAGGSEGINIEGDTVDFLAAQDTTQQSGSERDIDAAGQVALLGKAKGAGIELGYGQQKAEASSSTAVVGSLSAGAGGVNIRSRGDTTLEGTQVDARTGVNIGSTEGEVNLLAATSTADSKSQGFSIGIGAGTNRVEHSEKGSGKKGASATEGGLSGGYNQGDSTSVTSTVTKINSGGGVTLSSGGGKATLQGTQIQAGDEGIQIDAAKVDLLEAVTSRKGSGFGISLDGNVGNAEGESNTHNTSGTGVGTHTQAGANVSAQVVDIAKGQTVKLGSTGGIQINADKVTNQEAQFEGTQTTITGEQTQLARTNRKLDVDVASELEFDSRRFQRDKAADNTAATDAANTANQDPTADANKAALQDSNNAAILGAQNSLNQAPQQNLQNQPTETEFGGHTTDAPETGLDLGKAPKIGSGIDNLLVTTTLPTRTGGGTTGATVPRNPPTVQIGVPDAVNQIGGSTNDLFTSPRPGFDPATDLMNAQPQATPRTQAAGVQPGTPGSAPRGVARAPAVDTSGVDLVNRTAPIGASPGAQLRSPSATEAPIGGGVSGASLIEGGAGRGLASPSTRTAVGIEANRSPSIAGPTDLATPIGATAPAARGLGAPVAVQTAPAAALAGNGEGASLSRLTAPQTALSSTRPVQPEAPPDIAIKALPLQPGTGMRTPPPSQPPAPPERPTPARPTPPTVETALRPPVEPGTPSVPTVIEPKLPPLVQPGTTPTPSPTTPGIEMVKLPPVEPGTPSVPPVIEPKLPPPVQPGTTPTPSPTTPGIETVKLPPVEPGTPIVPPVIEPQLPPPVPPGTTPTPLPTTPEIKTVTVPPSEPGTPTPSPSPASPPIETALLTPPEPRVVRKPSPPDELDDKAPGTAPAEPPVTEVSQPEPQTPPSLGIPDEEAPPEEIAALDPRCVGASMHYVVSDVDQQDQEQIEQSILDERADGGDGSEAQRRKKPEQNQHRTTVSAYNTADCAGGNRFDGTGGSAGRRDRLSTAGANALDAEALAAALHVPGTVAVAVTLPPGADASSAKLKGADAKAAPDWLRFDPKTRILGGQSPVGFKGTIDVLIDVVDAEGAVRSIPVSLVVQ
jgi:filamentous hemagglutinin family protein